MLQLVLAAREADVAVVFSPAVLGGPPTAVPLIAIAMLYCCTKDDPEEEELRHKHKFDFSMSPRPASGPISSACSSRSHS